MLPSGAEREWLVDLKYNVLLDMNDNFIYIFAFRRFGHFIMLIITFNEIWYNKNYPIEQK